MSSTFLADFSRTLASAAERGSSPETPLGLLAAETREPAARAALEAVVRDLRDGVGLGEALSRHPGLFPSEYLGLVRAAFESGAPSDLLRLAATYHGLSAQVGARLRRLLVLAFLVIAVCGVLMTAGVILGLRYSKAVGEVGDFFHYRYPESTAALWTVRASTILSWVVIGGAVAGLPAALFLLPWLSRRRAGYWIPVWGRALRSRDLAFFCATVAVRSRAGIPLPEALAAAGGALRNQHARREVEELRSCVAEGEALSTVLHRRRFFPRTLAWAVSLGETRSSVADAFETLAEIHASDLERNLEICLVLMTPLGLLLLGNCVLVSAGCVLGPLFTILSGLTRY